MPDQPQVTTTTIDVNALGSLGFAPTADAAVTPKTKDMFDFRTPTDKITGPSIAEALKNQKAADAPDKQEQTPELGIDGKPKAITPDINLLNTLADGLQQDMKEAAANQDTPEGGAKPAGDIPVQGDKSDKAYKNAMVQYLKGKIEKGEFLPYEDFDESKEKITDYLNKFTNEDLEALAETNDRTRQEKFQDEYRNGFIQTLPEHLQWVVGNLIDGSADPQAVYAALARVEQSRKLDPAAEGDQAGIARNYLQATNFGTPDEIAAQIEEWKEGDVLGKKAAQFKPKLDKMVEDQVKQYAQDAEQSKEQQRQAANYYVENVTNTLKELKLGELPITKKQAESLYRWQVQDIQPSVRTGQPTNALWRALENIQFVKPDFGLQSEITWLANDPKGYRDWVMQQGKNEQQAKVTRELKGQQGVNTYGTDPEGDQKKVTKLPKPKSMFEFN